MERTIINSQVFAHVLCVKLTSLSNNLCEKRKEVVKYTVINRLTIICYFIRAICVPITKAKFSNFRLTSLIVNEFSVSRALVSLIFDTLSEEKEEEQEGIYFILFILEIGIEIHVNEKKKKKRKSVLDPSRDHPPSCIELIDSLDSRNANLFELRSL